MPLLATAPMCGCSVRMSGVPPYKVSIMEIRVSLQRGNADGKTIYDTGAGESGWWPGAACQLKLFMTSANTIKTRSLYITAALLRER